MPQSINNKYLKFLTSGLTSLILILLICLLTPSVSQAQVSVTLEANPVRMQMEDIFQLTVKINNTRSAEDINIGGLEDFQVSNPSSSTQTTLAKGSLNQSVVYTYRARPLKVGDFTIGPATVKVGDQLYASRKIQVKVDPMEEVRGRDNQSLYMTTEVLPKAAYPGQELLCRIRCYWNMSTGSVNFEGFPDIPGLTFTPVQKPRSFRKSIKGVPYEVGEWLYAINADEVGDYSIPALSVLVEIVKPNQQRSRYPRGIFDDRFFGNERREKKRVFSEPVSFSILPFPVEGQPSDFNGLLGEYSATATLEPQEVKAGESATLTLVLVGRGNVQLMPDLELPKLPAVKVYPDKPVFEDGRADQGLFGRKTMKWALVPQVEGTVDIPPFSVPYFNTKAGKYQYARSQKLRLNVLPGEVPVQDTQMTEMTVTTPAKHRVELLGEDILKIQESPDSLSMGSAKTIPLWIMILVLGLPMLPLVGSMAVRRMAHISSGQTKARTAKKAYGNFSKAVKDLEPNQAGDAFRALQEYLADRLGLDGATLTSHETEEKLLALGVDPEIVSSLTNLFSRLETCLFSQCDLDFSGETKQELLDVVKAVDKKVKT